MSDIYQWIIKRCNIARGAILFDHRVGTFIGRRRRWYFFKMQTLNCLSLKILTQNLIMLLIGELSKCKTFKMQKLKWPSFKISTQNLLLSVSYCQHTMKCHLLLFTNCKLFTLSGARARFVPSYGAFPADDQQHQKTRSLAADDAAMQRIRPASENILGSTVRLSCKKSIMSTPLLTFILTYQKVHCAVRCDATVFHWLAFPSSQPVGILAHMKK